MCRLESRPCSPAREKAPTFESTLALSYSHSSLDEVSGDPIDGASQKQVRDERQQQNDDDQLEWIDPMRSERGCRLPCQAALLRPLLSPILDISPKFKKVGIPMWYGFDPEI